MSFDAVAGMPPRLTVYSSLIAGKNAKGQLLLDQDFVAGMTLHAQNWPGPVTAVLREGASAKSAEIRSYSSDLLGFSVHLLSADAALDSALQPGPGVVMALADRPDHLSLVQPARRMGLGVVFGIDAPLSERIGAVLRDPCSGWVRRLYSAGQTLRQEGAMRKIMREADGIQMNGFSALQDYLGVNRHMIRYLDHRMRQDMLADAEALAQREQVLMAGRPLRLIHSDVLERYAGAQHLLPLAIALRMAGVAFFMEIEGQGALAADIISGIAEHGLGDLLSYRGMAGRERLPEARQGDTADLRISCRPYSSGARECVESMACGVPVLGFDNRMLSPLIRDSKGGWTVPVHDIGRMAGLVAKLDRQRDLLVQASYAAAGYASRHSFEAEYQRRNRHLHDVFVRTRPEPFVLGALLRQHVPAGS